MRLLVKVTKANSPKTMDIVTYDDFLGVLRIYTFVNLMHYKVTRERGKYSKDNNPKSDADDTEVAFNLLIYF